MSTKSHETEVLNGDGAQLILAYALRQKGLLFFGVIALIAAAIGTLLLFGNAGWFTNKIFMSNDRASVDRALLVFLIGLVGVAVISALRFSLFSVFGERVANDIRRDLFSHTLMFEYSFFETNKPGELASRISADASVIHQALSSTISVAGRNLLTLIGGIGLLLVRSPILILAILIVAPLAVIPLHIWGKRVRKASIQAQEALSEATGHVTETIFGIETVKLFGQEVAEGQRFSEVIKRLELFSLRQVRFRAFMNLLLTVLLFGALAIIVWIAARQVVSETMSSADMASSIGLFIVIASSLAALGDMFGEFQKVRGAADRIADLLGRESKRASQKGKSGFVANDSVGIEINDVSFSYPTRLNQMAIDDFSMEISPGEKVALVGPSGAGKTTLFKLLLNLYQPDTGTILAKWDDGRRSELGVHNALISVVPQDVMIFTDTALANILFASPSATIEQVHAAAKTAYSHQFINQLPDGYDTQLGQRGVRLSGGQRQRIAIARAALRNSPILLLDEATSSLDSQSEQIVLDAFKKLMGTRTTLVIAHRLSTVADADRIVVMHKGRIVDQGRHGELLARCELYQKLSKSQLSSDVLEV